MSDEEKIIEFNEWWNSDDRNTKPSPLLRALLRGDDHPMLREHEASFPADMGIVDDARVVLSGSLNQTTGTQAAQNGNETST